MPGLGLGVKEPELGQTSHVRAVRQQWVPSETGGEHHGPMWENFPRGIG